MLHSTAISSLPAVALGRDGALREFAELAYPKRTRISEFGGDDYFSSRRQPDSNGDESNVLNSLLASKLVSRYTGKVGPRSFSLAT